MTLLDVEGLLVRFGGTIAVRGMTFGVDASEIVGLVGANGAGKTTAIRAGLGLQRPTAGRVRLMGTPPSRSARTRVGYVPQSLGLWQDLTVAQNLAFVAAAYGTRPAELPPDLVKVRNKPVGGLPAGYRRRVAFEAALSHDPRLLILDEPTSGVGPLERTQLWDRIHDAREAGTGVLVTTHHMSEVEQCDRVIVLLAGRVAAFGTMDSLLADETAVVVTADDRQTAFARLDAAFVGVALAGRTIRVPDADVAAVTRALGGLPAEVTTAPASFDEMFVALGRAG